MISEQTADNLSDEELLFHQLQPFAYREGAGNKERIKIELDQCDLRLTESQDNMINLFSSDHICNALGSEDSDEAPGSVSSHRISLSKDLIEKIYRFALVLSSLLAKREEFEKAILVLEKAKKILSRMQQASAEISGVLNLTHASIYMHWYFKSEPKKFDVFLTEFTRLRDKAFASFTELASLE